jgi:hypothetical protein
MTEARKKDFMASMSKMQTPLRTSTVESGQDYMHSHVYPGVVASPDWGTQRGILLRSLTESRLTLHLILPRPSLPASPELLSALRQLSLEKQT